MIDSFKEPIRVYGEASIAISDVKEMEATDEYLGLDERTRKCQDKEPFENCTTRQYLDRVQNVCNCVPYALRDFSENHTV